MMCVGDYSHHNHTERLLADRLFKGRVKEYSFQQGLSLPESVDWRTAGAVTFVKDQVIIHNRCSTESQCDSKLIIIGIVCTSELISSKSIPH